MRFEETLNWIRAREFTLELLQGGIKKILNRRVKELFVVIEGKQRFLSLENP